MASAAHSRPRCLAWPCRSRRIFLPLQSTAHRHAVLQRIALGMERGYALLCSFRLPDHIHSAGSSKQTELLPQFLCSSRAEHLAGLRARVGGLLRQSGLVCGSTSECALVGVCAVCAESFSLCTAFCDWSHMV